MMIEKLRAVVAVEAKDWECDHSLDITDLPKHTLGTLAPDGPVFSPSGEDIRKGQAVDEVTSHRVAAMGDGVGFEETRPGNIPVVGLDRDLVFKQRPWLCTATPLLVKRSHRLY